MIDERIRLLLVPICAGGTLIGRSLGPNLYRVKRYGNFHVDVERAELGNKLVMRPIEGRDRVHFWWYDGSGIPCFFAAVSCAAMWNPGKQTDPLGWNENGQTGAKRSANDPDAWQAARMPLTLAEFEADDSMWPDVPNHSSEGTETPMSDGDTIDKVYAPFTAEQVQHLNAFQADGLMHPFTCPKAARPDEDPYHSVESVLVATTDGWVCPVDGCTYTQDWAHSFMAAWTSAGR